MIAGYPRRASVLPGEVLVLHVSTDAPRFRVHVHRWHEGLVAMMRSPWLPGRSVPPGSADRDWCWPAYELPIPCDWPSGVYLAHLEEPDGDRPRIWTDHGAVLFVVRSRRRTRMLYKVPLATYHAYNITGGGCFYMSPPRSADPPGSKVTLRRPGGGIGGEVWGAVDHYDTRSPRQTFAHWDAKFIRWLARNGYRTQFCTDFDIHRDPALLTGHKLLVSVGHDEYWSDAMRDAVEAFVAGGGNVAFFGANVCWWRIHVVDDCAMVCHQGGPHGAIDHWWPQSGAARPEDSLTGVSYRHGGGWWDGPRRTGGFIVQRPEHWAFCGTGLRLGERFGADTRPPLVGYECDGAPFDRLDPSTGVAVLAPSRARCGTPARFTPLAVGPLDAGWQELPPREMHSAGEGVHSATMGTFTNGGTVLTVGTTDWAQVLDTGEPQVARITANILDRLLAD